jgi:hypothetical protein
MSQGQYTDTRTIAAVAAFFFTLTAEGILCWQAIKLFTDLFVPWFEAAPLLVLGIIGLQFCWPIVVFYLVYTGGRKIGDEAEEVARGMKQ